MNTWLIHIGEPLPVDGPVRLFRYGLLAEELLRRGGRVVQWAGSMNHFTKRQRDHRHRTIEVAPGYEVELLYGQGYRRHVGLSRLRYQRQVARAFIQRAQRRPSPDVVVASLPTIELAAAAVEFARRVGARVVVDVRDLWPDVYANALPAPLRPLARPILGPARRTAARALASADSLAAVSTSYLDWGLNLAGRSRRSDDRVYYHGYRPTPLDPSEGSPAERYWDDRGVTATDQLRLCFFGTLGRSAHLAPFIDAVDIVNRSRGGQVELVVCGDGPKLRHYERLCRHRVGATMYGWVDRPRLTELMRRSHVGVAAYQPDAPQSLPNKPIEYLAGGLGILSTLAGPDLESLLSRNGCGETVRAPTPQSLARVITAWIDNKDRVEAMRENASKLFDSRFNADVVYRDMASHLEDIAAARSAPYPSAAA